MLKRTLITAQCACVVNNLTLPLSLFLNKTTHVIDGYTNRVELRRVELHKGANNCQLIVAGVQRFLRYADEAHLRIA